MEVMKKDDEEREVRFRIIQRTEKTGVDAL